MSKSKLKPSREIQRVPLELLSHDERNTRRVFNPEKLKELAESLLQQGQLQNLECGPDGVVHIGNRRLRALREIVLPKLDKEIDRVLSAVYLGSNQPGDPGAERHDLEVRFELLRRPLVRVLNQEEVKDAKLRQFVENIQREDVSVHDEALAFRDLLEEVGENGERVHSTGSIAARIGKDPEYVRQRLKIVNCPKAMLDALAAGRVSLHRALMVSRIPSPKARVECASRVLNPKLLDRPLSDAETAKLIREDYMIKLDRPPFDPEAASLVPGAGACSTCRFRSGNDPELKGDLQVVGKGSSTATISPNLCTSPDCYREKAAASWEALEEGAKKGGFAVLPLEEADSVFSGPRGSLPMKSEWVDLDAKPGPKDVGHYDEGKVVKWRSMLKGAEVPITKARHPGTNRVHDLVPREAAKAALQVRAAEKGESSIVAVASREERDKAEKKRKALERREERLKKEVSIAVLDALADKMTAKWVWPVKLPIGDRRAIEVGLHLEREAAMGVLESVLDVSADGCAFYAEWLEVEKPGPGAGGRDFLPVILALVRNRRPAFSMRELWSFVAIAAVAPSVKYHGAFSADLARLCAVYDVDVKAIDKEVREGRKGKVAKKQPGEGSRATKEERPMVELAADAYESRLEKGEDVKLSDVEDEFGLKRDQLRNFRKNRARLAKARKGKGSK